MEHTHIVTANDLESFADRRESEGVIPEFISHLIKETVQDLTVCRIPYGDAVGQPGLDGIVETVLGGRHYVPAGKSVWEIGTGAAPQSKATNDFRKRTKNTLSLERKGTTYVVVTPHAARWAQPKQVKWLIKRKKDGWKDIKIIDGVVMEDWLREFPVLGLSLLKRIGLIRRMAGISLPTEHWVNLQEMRSNGAPPLPPKLFLVGREQARQKFQQLLEGQEHQLALGFESTLDVDDFIAACIAEADAGDSTIPHRRCLLIRDADAWLTMAKLKTRHVLVAHPSLDLESAGEQLALTARSHGHAVVIPVEGCARIGDGAGNIIPLRSPSAQQIEQCLIDAKYPLERARIISGAGALSLAALKRHLRGLGERPPYTGWHTAGELALAAAVGRWNGNNAADRAAMEDLLGKSYGEWIETLRPESLRADTPLSQRDEQWKVISRGETWNALGQRFSDDTLDRISKVALTVLGEPDPKFDLEPDRRFAAAVEGKALKHSAALRQGIAETLALLGSKPRSLSSCSLHRPETTAVLIVRKLLHDADWKAWASMNSELPMLAEAAPDEFMDQVEAALTKDESPFVKIYEQEGKGAFGSNYMTGLLWALETLAWSPLYLVRVVSLLGDLAAIDPGGNWTNRPSNSIKDILLPWHYHTTAPFEKRKIAVEALQREQPDVYWSVLLALLPSHHDVTSGTRRPAWQPWAHQVTDLKISRQDYWQQILVYAEMATRMAASDTAKLSALIDRLPSLPLPAHQKVVEHLKSQAVLKLPDADRVNLWEAVSDLVSRHRQHSEAKWAMPAALVDQLATAAESLAPNSLQYSQRRLFSERDFDLLDHEGNYQEQHARLNAKREDVVARVYADAGITGVLEFAKIVSSPARVGEALGRSPLDVDHEMLPALLDQVDAIEEAFVGGFLWQRYWKRSASWIDTLPLQSWTVPERLRLMTRLPFAEGVWSRLATIVGEAENEYWKIVPSPNPWQEDTDKMILPAEKLLAAQRPRAALRCLYRIASDKKPLPPELAIQILLEAAGSVHEGITVSSHDLVTIIEALQANPAIDRQELLRVEWTYIEVLDHEFGGVPKALEQELAENPAFFAELIRLVFRSDAEKVNPQSEPTDAQRKIAMGAFKVLQAWKRVPGIKSDGSFDPVAFKSWVGSALTSVTESGHLRVAQSQLGQTLTYAPVDLDGLWIHRDVAAVLDGKKAEPMRSGFTMELFNQRGVYGLSGGRDELKIASDYHGKADALESASFVRLATALRELAKQYERDAEREAKRGEFGD
jgi:hypothetical protein